MSRPGQKIIAFAHWPPCDRAVWIEAIADGDLFDGRGPAAHWSDASRRVTVAGYGRWIGFLASTEPEALTLLPADRVTPDRVRAYIAMLETSLSPCGIWNYVKNLRNGLSVMSPGEDFGWLGTIEQRLWLKADAQTCNKPVPSSDRLVALGLDLMDRARQSWETLRYQARLDYRDGLLIALLALVPLRRRNIAMIRIGQHLLRSEDGWSLVFEADETKNRRPIEFAIPDLLTAPIEHYLAVIRPAFREAAKHDRLWASLKTGGLSGDAIYCAVRKRVRAELGIDLTLHQFRDAAATTLAHSGPEDVMLARDLLGHADFGTTKKHYIRADSIDAGRQFAALLAKEREAVRSNLRRRMS